ncbi:hypothetical protein QO179_24600 [Bacillus stercoris]|nr:hypothetical protein [Bacillus stercoris]
MTQFTVELPKDSNGQKTTAVPSDVATQQTEWVTPIYIYNENIAGGETLGSVKLTDGTNPLKINEDGSITTKQLGTTIKDAFSGLESATKMYETNMHGFTITNDGSEEISFTINEMTITVKPGESFDGTFDAFTQVDIISNVEYRAIVKE